MTTGIVPFSPTVPFCDAVNRSTIIRRYNHHLSLLSTPSPSSRSLHSLSLIALSTDIVLIRLSPVDCSISIWINVVPPPGPPPPSLYINISLSSSLGRRPVSLGDRPRSPFACRMLIVDLFLLSLLTKLLHSGPLTLAAKRWVQRASTLFLGATAGRLQSYFLAADCDHDVVHPPDIGTWKILVGAAGVGCRSCLFTEVRRGGRRRRPWPWSMVMVMVEDRNCVERTDRP